MSWKKSKTCVSYKIILAVIIGNYKIIRFNLINIYDHILDSI
jgi:hypothetical protein